MKKRGNGEGSMTKLPNGLYKGSYTIGGKRKAIYQHVNESKDQFNKRFLEIIYNINAGTYIDKTKDTIYTISKKYIDQSLEDGLVSPRTYKRNLDTLNLLKKCLGDVINIEIDKVTVDMIEGSKNRMRDYSESTINKLWILLKKTFKIAYSRRKIPYNIMEDETLNKPVSKHSKKIVEALSVEQEQKLLSILNNEEKDHKYANIIKLQLFTGMRLGEVLARKITDVDFKNNTLNIDDTLTQDDKGNTILGKHTKTYSQRSHIDSGKRVIPLSRESEKILGQEISTYIDNPYKLIFWNYDKDDFITVSNVNCYLRRLNIKYKIAPTLQSHILRHTRITRLNESGVDIMVIQSLVGHTIGSEITRLNYISISDDYIRSELTKINEL
jgi:integrase